MEKTEQEKFVDAVMKKDDATAKECLEKLLKKKCAKKIVDVLSK